jgi:hypothetical protein
MGLEVGITSVVVIARISSNYFQRGLAWEILYGRDRPTTYSD